MKGKYTYKVMLEDWCFESLVNQHLAGEFDNPDDAFDLMDKLQSEIDTSCVKVGSYYFDSVDVIVERVDVEDSR